MSAFNRDNDVNDVGVGWWGSLTEEVKRICIENNATTMTHRNNDNIQYANFLFLLDYTTHIHP